MAPTGSDPEWAFVAYDGTPLAEADRPLRLTATTGRPQIAVKLGLQRGDGSTRWLSVSTRAVETERDPPYTVVLSFSDVTDERNALEALARSNAELGQFAYVASHDLSEPLRMVSSYLNLLRRRYRGRLDSDADEFIDYAVDGASRMRSLIEALLAYSRAGAGEKPARVELGSVTANVLRSLAAALVEAGAEIEIGELPAVMGDRAQLEQLLQNLVANALKFRADGRARVWVYTEQTDGEMARIVVADGGIGIAADQRDQVFEMSSACTTARPTRARASVSRSAARSSNGTADKWIENGRRAASCGSRWQIDLTTMSDIAIPRLSDSMEEGTILKWLKSDGDEVSKGEELVEIETDKANMTYEADESGTLEIVASGGRHAAGRRDDRADRRGRRRSSTTSRARSRSPTRTSDEQEEPRTRPRTEADEGDRRGRGRRGRGARTRKKRRPRRTRRSPRPRSPRTSLSRSPTTDRVKALADRPPDGARAGPRPVADIEGSGPGGRIVKADIEAAERRRRGAAGRGGARAEAEEAPAEEPKEGGAQAREGQRPRRRHPHRAHAAAAHGRAPDGGVQGHRAGLRDDARGRHGGGRRAARPAQGRRRRRARRRRFNDFVVKAAALALRDFPRANGAYRDGQFELYLRVNVGVAVAGQDALVVPTVFDADKKEPRARSPPSRGAWRNACVRARSPRPSCPPARSRSRTSACTGFRRFVAVINPPQAAILAVGESLPRLAVRDGALVVRALMGLTLTCDHRILDGADAAEFLAKIRAVLEAPLVACALSARSARSAHRAVIARSAPARRLVGVDEQADRHLSPGRSTHAR